MEVYTNVAEDKLLGNTPDPTWGCLEPAATVEKTFPYRGFYTIRLKNPIKLDPGQYFTVVVHPSVGGLASSRGEKSNNDLTFMTTAAGGWRNTRNTTFGDTLRLKAYTKLRAPGEVAPPIITPVPSPTVIPSATVTPAPVSPTNAPDVPATGDETPLALYAGLLALCLGGLALTLVRKRKTDR